MDSIDLIRENLRNSTDIVLSKVDEMRDHALVVPTPRGGAHTLWILGHLTYIEGLVIRAFMLGEPNPRADWETPFDGADVSTNAADYPPFDEVLAACRDARASTIALLDEQTEADLDRASAAAPKGAEAHFDTRRRCFQFVSDHWFMHRGQLADSRRASGIDRMWF